MPPKKRVAPLPKVQNTSFQEIQKGQEELKKKKGRKRKVTLDAPLRSSTLQDPQLYIKDLKGDVTDYTGGQDAYFPVQYTPSGQFFQGENQNNHFIPDERSVFSNNYDNMSVVSSLYDPDNDSEDQKENDYSTNASTISSKPGDDYYNPLNNFLFSENEIKKEKQTATKSTKSVKKKPITEEESVFGAKKRAKKKTTTTKIPFNEEENKKRMREGERKIEVERLLKKYKKKTIGDEFENPLLEKKRKRADSKDNMEIDDASTITKKEKKKLKGKKKNQNIEYGPDLTKKVIKNPFKNPFK